MIEIQSGFNAPSALTEAEGLLSGSPTQLTAESIANVLPSQIETNDISAKQTTTATLLVGQSYQGFISTYGDHDWFRVELQAGQTYTFASIGTGLNSLNQTYLVLRNGSGNIIAADATSGVGTSSVIGMPAPLGGGVFSAPYTGLYFLDVGSINPVATGQYGVSAVISSPTNAYKPGFDIAMGAGSIHTSVNYPGVPYDWNQINGTPRGGSVTLTYSFRDSMTYSSANGTFSKCTAAEMSAVTAILKQFSDIANINFTNVNPSGYSNNAQIVIGNYNQPASAAGAYAYQPSNAVNGSGGDLWLNTSSINTNSIPKGSYSWFAIMHELGHALGLSHPGDYNAGTGTPTYLNAAQFIQDSEQYTMMSYWEGQSTGASPGKFATAYTPMLLDIFELQTLYGTNLATRITDNVYGFNNTAGDTYSFSNSAPPQYCIWDAGGTDTLDCSNYAQNQQINLNEGNFSNIGGGISNLSIAIGAQIENAIGGLANDRIIGNALNNRLQGGSGNDQIDGGAGLDLGIYSGLLNQYLLGSSSAGFSVSDTQSSRDGADLLQNVERLRFADLSVALDKAVGQIGGEAYRLYKAAFDRTPDLDGLGSWIKALDNGTSLTEVATRFLVSDEFQNKNGGANPSNDTLVTLLYKNVLHRNPDNSGYTAWVNALESHDLTKEAVLIRFSESDENIKQTDPLIANGIQYHEWWLTS